eukprot:SAG11_NODE_1549_length_4701_cov_1.707518_7_plen_84_part_00
MLVLTGGLVLCAMWISPRDARSGRAAAQNARSSDRLHSISEFCRGAPPPVSFAPIALVLAHRSAEVGEPGARTAAPAQRAPTR